MRSTFHALEVARRGLYAQQTALSTTGHNIANASTEGYSRQRVNLTATRAIEMPGLNRSVVPGQLGTGVAFDSIKRIRDSFLDDQFRNEYQSFGNWNVQKDTLEKIELLFNEPSDNGLNEVISEFWNSWHVLSGKPDDLTARHVLKENTIAMLDSFKYTDTKLTELKEDLSTSIDIKTSEANTYIRQIAELNQEIKRIELVGDDANDLRDKRDLLADKLSQIAQIKVREQPDGMYTITLPGDGTQLVNGANFNNLGAGGVDLNLITGGEIHGMIQARDVIVNKNQAELNTMLKGLVYGEVEVTIPKGSILPVDLVDAEGTVILEAGTVATEPIKHTVKGINGLHSLGWTMGKDADGNEVAVGGIPFFVPLNQAEFSIQSMELNPDIVDNVGLIAASLRVDSDGTVLKGNNALALIMAQLKDSKFSFESATGTSVDGTLQEYLRSVTGVLGVESKYAQDQISKQSSMLVSIENQRQSVSGVSLDEEMANLIKFQHAYNASARMMTTVDQLLDRIINNMGIVGR